SDVCSSDLAAPRKDDIYKTAILEPVDLGFSGQMGGLDPAGTFVRFLNRLLDRRVEQLPEVRYVKADLTMPLEIVVHDRCSDLEEGIFWITARFDPLIHLFGQRQHVVLAKAGAEAFGPAQPLFKTVAIEHQQGTRILDIAGDAVLCIEVDKAVDIVFAQLSHDRCRVLLAFGRCDRRRIRHNSLFGDRAQRYPGNIGSGIYADEMNCP